MQNVSDLKISDRVRGAEGGRGRGTRETTRAERMRTEEDGELAEAGEGGQRREQGDA